MESVHDIKEALSARSRTATLDELANEGRKKVRLIRAEHVAAMISEAVHSAIEQSGLIAPDEAEKLVEKSRQEFRTILRERELEAQQAHANEEALAAREREVAELTKQREQAQAELAALQNERTAANDENARLRDALTAAEAATASASVRIEELTAELAVARAAQLTATHERDHALANASAPQAELAQLHEALAEAQGHNAQAKNEIEHLRAELQQAHGEVEAARAAVATANAAATAAAAAAAAAAHQPASAPAASPSSELLLSLVQEMATLKANLLHAQSQPAPQPQAQAQAPDFTKAFEKLTGSLNDRLEQLGKKMGVSAAVGGDAQVDFGGLFKDAGSSLESNMDAIEVKQKAGGGIAGNLARLKKLKGGG